MADWDSIKPIIISGLNAGGVDSTTAKFWAAVSAFETGYFTSRAYRDYHNLFGMHFTPADPFAVNSVAGDGGQLAVYRSYEDSVKGLIAYFGRLKWPTLNFKTLTDLVDMMNAKNYFAVSKSTYLAGVSNTYAKLFPNA